MSEHELPHEIVEEEAELHRDKRVALWIGAFAVMLALAEILGQRAQVTALQSNIEASNQWAFFQAKAERETTYGVAVDTLGALLPILPDAPRREASAKIEKWRAASAKLHDDPEKKNGTVQLYERAKEAEKERDRAERKHNRYELAGAGLHIAIVLASASIITGLPLLLTVAQGLSAVSVLMALLGLVF